jgi:ABC-type multidrug transport system fused ATPase/permease subunit
MKKVEQRTASIKSILFLYFRNAKGIWVIIPFKLVLLALDGVIQSRIPVLLKELLDGITQNAALFIRERLSWFGITVLILSGSWYLIATTHHYIISKISVQLMTRLRVNLYSYLQKLSMDFYQKTRIGEITSRLTGDIVNAGTLYRTFNYIFWSLSLIIPSGITIVRINWRLSIVFFVLLFITSAFTVAIIPMLRRRQREVLNQSGRINAQITEDISSISLTKAFGMERFVAEGVDQECSVFIKKSLVMARFRVICMDLIGLFMKFLSPFIILYIGAKLTGSGLAVGTLAAFYTYWHIVSVPIHSIVEKLQVVFDSFASFDRIMEFYREEPLIKDIKDAEPLKLKSGTIKFRGVYFNYPVETHKRVLNNINFSIKGHQSIAIIGGSGAGKSTLISLIMRFYDPLRGQVYIDGQDISCVTQNSLRKNIGLVMQDSVLLSGSIRYNMKFAKPEASDEEIINALKRVKMWDYVKNTPDGLSTIVGERGVMLSGGQKQRLSIARVFLKNPEIVLFDEATSSLDAITEKQIQKTMAALFKNRTSIIIAHRISTVINCDKIFLMEKGTIIASGNHQKLLKNNSVYRNYCREQNIFT